MIDRLKKLSHSMQARQGAALYSAMLINTALMVVTSIINTDVLGPKQYGDFSFLATVFNLILLITSTGQFSALQPMLSTAKNEAETRSLLGTGLVITGKIALIMVFFTAIFSLFQNRIFHNDLGPTIRILLIPLLFLPLQNFLESVLAGTNRIYNLALVRVLPKLGYLITILIFMQFYKLTNLRAQFIQLSLIAIVGMISVSRLKPNIATYKNYSKALSHETKHFGSHIYIGSLFGVATGHLGSLLISYYLDNTNLGFYNLAYMVTTPLTLIPAAIGTTYFKRFANSITIPPKVLKSTLLFSLIALVGFMIVIKPVMLIFYSKKFASAIPLTYILSIGSIMHGLGDFFNRFLLSHKRGKEIRNGAILNGVLNLLFFATLIPLLANTGAALARMLASSFYCLLMLFAYMKHINKKHDTEVIHETSTHT